ncbi:MAG: YARHG domain-containing protein [Lachnospiraceae bacterium]|nr:YARHG domain-containing protein [Lachnospiraceae bacterium]
MKEREEKQRKMEHRKFLWRCKIWHLILTKIGCGILFVGAFGIGISIQAAAASGYIFPDSAQRYMSEAELYDLPLQVINYGKNEIYAKRGRRFRSQELQGYFDGQSWYSGIISPDDFDENSLNDYERINAHMINDYEHEISDGYKLDQGGYSYEAVYDYLVPTEESEWDDGSFIVGENENGNGGFEEGKTGDSRDTEDTVLADGSVLHKSQYGTVTFKLEYQDGGQSLYGVIRAADSSGAVLWERTTDSYMCAGYAQVTDLGINGERYYYEEGGTIVAVRIADGAILWKSVQALGAPRCCFGPGDMIYLCGYYGPDFVALDRTGKSLQYTNSLDADFAYTTAIWYEAGTVYVTKDGSASGQSAKTFAVDVSWMELESEADIKADENGEENEKETKMEKENQGTEEIKEEEPANQEIKEEVWTDENVKTEAGQEETVTYDDWIRQNLVSLLGICDTGTFSNIMSSQDYNNWFHQSGVLSRYEKDLDGDGAPEALVVYLKEQENEETGYSYTRLHLAVLEGEGSGVQNVYDMGCTGFSGMGADMQLFAFEQEKKTYFALQKFTRFNGVFETLAIFHVEDGRIQIDCLLSDPGYTSGVALQKIETDGSEDGLYSDSEYENRETLYNYEYDGRAELLDCWQNPEYGEALNAQIEPYGLEAAVSATRFGSSMWRLKEENLTELCRIYATSDDMGMTTDKTIVCKYIYSICDDTGLTSALERQ